MRISSIDPDNTTQKTSIGFALDRGYRFKLGDMDGEGEVTSPKDRVYHIHNWQCDCPDARGRDGGSYTLPDERHVCKHVLYLSQLYACDTCKGMMLMRFGLPWRYFACLKPGCGALKAFQAVKVERVQARNTSVEETILKGEEASRLVFAD